MDELVCMGLLTKPDWIIMCRSYKMDLRVRQSNKFIDNFYVKAIQCLQAPKIHSINRSFNYYVVNYVRNDSLQSSSKQRRMNVELCAVNMQLDIFYLHIHKTYLHGSSGFLVNNSRKKEVKKTKSGGSRCIQSIDKINCRNFCNEERQEDICQCL